MKEPPSKNRVSRIVGGEEAQQSTNGQFSVLSCAFLQPFWICVLLIVGTAAVYWPIGTHGFIACDDPDYVMDNPEVQAGLTWHGAVWAFTTDHANNWHPLTWLSHMTDVQLFGVRPGWHHLVNLLFHTANSLLLFLLLKRMTGAQWRSALVAALFAWHPLHVESVAWVAERKDVLSTFFFMLTLLAYAKYVEEKAESRKQKAETAEHGSRFQLSAFSFLLSAWYGLALALFALGLMSKPMLVTLPFVLLLLDFWPLHRLQFPDGLKPGAVRSSTFNVQRSELARLLVEKLPFLALSAVSCIVTFIVQGREGNVASFSRLPIDLRIANALLSYLLYLGKTFWPTGLAVHYPYPKAMPVELLILAAMVVLGISTLAFLSLRRRPWLATGWFWYLGTLVPVIGLVQAGEQARADRYTYITLIGLSIAVVWGVSDAASALCARCRKETHLGGIGRLALTLISLAALSACLALTVSQVRLWKDTETLYRHALSVTSDNAHAHLNLGTALSWRGDDEEAAIHFAEAVRINPNYAEARSNLGFILAQKGKLDEAIGQYRAALAIRPDLGRTHYLLGNALLAQGKRLEAVAEYKATLAVKPDHPLALNDLAWTLSTNPDPQERNGFEAVRLAENLCRQTVFHEAQYVGTLAAAYAEAGRFDDAVRTAEKAKDLALAAGQKDLAERNAQLLELYRAQKPYHEQPQNLKPGE
jgi:tetratricopeptide (TPR) repeat protein